MFYHTKDDEVRRAVAKELARRHNRERSGRPVSPPAATTTTTTAWPPRTGGPYRWLPGITRPKPPPRAGTSAPSTLPPTTTPTPTTEPPSEKTQEEVDDEVESTRLIVALVFSCIVTVAFLAVLFWTVFKSCHECFRVKKRFSDMLEQGNPNRMASCMGYRFKMKPMGKKGDKGEMGEEQGEEEQGDERDTARLTDDDDEAAGGESGQVAKVRWCNPIARFHHAAKDYDRLQEHDAEIGIFDIEVHHASPSVTTTTSAAATTTTAASIDVLNDATTAAPSVAKKQEE